MKRLVRTKKLFAFLRLHRHELFDEMFQEELEGMYRQTGAGAEPLPPALLCISPEPPRSTCCGAPQIELNIADTPAV